MSNRGEFGALIRQALAVVSAVCITGCTTLGLSPTYIKTHRFLDSQLARSKNPVFQIDVKPFSNKLKDRSKIGTKRVGTNKLAGPLVPTKDPIEITQEGVITQLQNKGISLGSSHLQLRGTVQDFFVDVDVNPASGRGKFSAVVKLDLAVWDTRQSQRLWRETYTGTASAPAPSVVDRAYDRALKVAFSSLMTQVQQDDSLLALRHAYKTPSTPKSNTPAPDAIPHKKPSPPPSTPDQPGDTTSPDIVFLTPQSKKGDTKIDTTATTLPISGLVADASGIAGVNIIGAAAPETPASAQELRNAGLPTSGMKFTGYAFLTSGMNRITIQATDRKGNKAKKVLTIQKKTLLDTTPPAFVLLEPPLTRALAVVSTKPIQQFIGLAADEGSGVAEIRINDDSAIITPVMPQELRSAGLSGKGIKFTGETELEKGQTQVRIKAVDRRGNMSKEQVFTIQRGK